MRLIDAKAFVSNEIETIQNTKGDDTDLESFYYGISRTLLHLNELSYDELFELRKYIAETFDISV